MKRSLRWLFATVLLASGWASATAHASEGVYAGVDLLFLAPKFNDLNLPNIFYGHGDGLTNVASTVGTVSSDLKFTQRVIIGYEGDQGAGVQVRWFTFDNDATYNGTIQHNVNGLVTLSGLLNIDVDAIDAELTQRGQFQVWDWFATAGARYARVSLREEVIGGIDFEGFSDAAWFGSTGVKFEGAGPTVSVGGSRSLWIDELSFYGRARTALLYGNAEQYSAWRAGGKALIPNEFVQVWEIQAGLQMEREYDSFGLLLGIFWEAQVWDADLLANLAFHGFGVRSGIKY